MSRVYYHFVVIPLLLTWLTGREASAQTEGDRRPDGGSAAESSAPESSSDDGDDDGDKPSLKIGGRIHTGWKWRHVDEPQTGEDEVTNTFLVRRARLKAVGELNSWLGGVVNIDAAAIFEANASILRDAYIRVEPLRQLELRVGQFKKPFSALELQSSGKLKVIERGEGNELIVEDLTYGDRDLGVQASGRLVKSLKLDYSLGVFNGTGPYFDDSDTSKDLAARVSVRPLKWLTAGASGSLKFFEESEDNEQQPGSGFAAGADVAIRLFGLRLWLEGMVAQDHQAWRSHPDEPDFATPLVVNFVGMLTQKHDLGLSWGLAVEPVFKVEFLDPDATIVADDVMLFTAGINAYFADSLRLLSQLELRDSRRNSDSSYRSDQTFTVLACLDI